MKKARILITGASGCVGQYTATWLLKNTEADLLLWLRDPSKLTAIDSNHPRVQLIVGDLRQPGIFANELSTVTRVIHTATAWGDPSRAYEVNVIAVEKLLDLLNPEKIEQIIYFSTASILKHNLSPLPEAFRYGTEYIQTKARCFKELQEHSFSDKIIAIFPTLVFGGRVDRKCIYPTSYLTEGLNKACEWLWLARWIKLFSRFHFIHAADIAFICGHLATTPNGPYSDENQLGIKKLVLGQEAISVNEAIKTLLNWKGMINTPAIPLTNWLIELLIKILPIKLTTWDRFCIKQKNFIHDPITTPESFGGRSYAKTLNEVLHVSGINRKKKHKRS
ncbi:NAD(P)-dependent oxidoreductase [Prochlorococcus sp. MIT 1223]|uniref:NAD-dependent epimerase/dehydratase family protein n=1 Tax=Prochlorococcus sp. MIT 1223 TaxID=3096217 RepID=UPI002A75DF7D|nr:NAD(P)-dependent oxidoreductase [Prochlorococcus sp. MIT 1223]